MTRRFWAPGRVNLIGEFTDLAGGVALPVALDLGITLVAEPAHTIELRSRELDELVSLAADGSGDATGFGRYVSGVASELALLGAAAGRAAWRAALDVADRRRAVVVGVSRRLEHSGYATRKRELEEGMPARVRHLESENVRVWQVVAALRAGDLPRVGELFREGHESLRLDFEVSIPELDHLVGWAYEHGAHAARMTGGGFGGAIVALVDDEDASTFAENIPARAWVSAASDGARELL